MFDHLCVPISCYLSACPIYQLPAMTWQCWCPSSDNVGGSPCPDWCSLPGACNTRIPDFKKIKAWGLVLYLMDSRYFPVIILRSKIKNFTYLRIYSYLFTQFVNKLVKAKIHFCLNFVKEELLPKQWDHVVNKLSKRVSIREVCR